MTLKRRLDRLEQAAAASVPGGFQVLTFEADVDPAERAAAIAEAEASGAEGIVVQYVTDWRENQENV